ncbi:DUF3363 domain-containing protein [Variovorax beijingensis]|uniref:DUF3363 domain-containing protein n=1 Tax=Variovorax beijingensis TaxID=2496117 RepID=A0A3P3EW89_9BURK|nr:DUF3363 domain-containing protein [Variovorax beijingensis]RRH90316.1 DUF3363 domain-containing protein [Variovorax beijingensis]
MATLRDRELASVGQDLQQQTSKTWRPMQDGQPASGVYRQSIPLASGRFAKGMDSAQVARLEKVISDSLKDPKSLRQRLPMRWCSPSWAVPPGASTSDLMRD